MILGIDKGNIETDTSTLIRIPSKVSKLGNLIGENLELNIDGQRLFIGSGDYETEFCKARQENFLPLMFTAIALSTNDVENQVVVGLPIGQYKQFKDELKQKILSNRIKDIELNNRARKIIISDAEVAPEGAVLDFEGVIIDIGGRSTDCCLKRYENNKMKIINPISYPKGTINLYSDACKLINGRYALDLAPSDMEKVFKKGLKINGDQKDINFVLDIFKDFVNGLVNDLRVEYSISTEEVCVLGGGGALLYKPIKNRIPQAQLSENSSFINAIKFQEVGEQLWL
jgi:plasmid segregation protein ParM